MIQIKKSGALRRAFSLLLALITALSLCCSAFAEAAPAKSRGTTLLFFSDFQHKDGWKDPNETLAGLLDALESSGVRPDNALICGDYSAIHGRNNHNGDPRPGIMQIKEEFTNQYGEDWDNDSMIFVQGNHDRKTGDISAPGLHAYDDYLVYVMNAETEYPSAQVSRKRKAIVQSGAKRLKKCLEKLVKAKETRPVFLASHVPLHFTARTSRKGDNLYASYLFEVLNSYGTKLNLVYLFGHNHDNGWDSYMGGSCIFRKPGDFLLIPKEKRKKKAPWYAKKTITFVYMNAGYCGYFAQASGESRLNCSTCTIKDGKLLFQRYSESGKCPLNGAGRANKTKNDKKLIPAKYYGKRKTGSFAVTRRKAA